MLFLAVNRDFNNEYLNDEPQLQCQLQIHQNYKKKKIILNLGNITLHSSIFLPMLDVLTAVFNGLNGFNGFASEHIVWKGLRRCSVDYMEYLGHFIWNKKQH